MNHIHEPECISFDGGHLCVCDIIRSAYQRGREDAADVVNVAIGDNGLLFNQDRPDEREKQPPVIINISRQISEREADRIRQAILVGKAGPKGFTTLTTGLFSWRGRPWPQRRSAARGDGKQA